MSVEGNKLRFCSCVNRFRKRQGLTIQELAEQSGVSLQILEQLEQNILPEEMMVDDTYKLAAVFHCKISELFQ